MMQTRQEKKSKRIYMNPNTYITLLIPTMLIALFFFFTPVLATDHPKIPEDVNCLTSTEGESPEEVFDKCVGEGSYEVHEISPEASEKIESGEAQPEVINQEKMPPPQRKMLTSDDAVRFNKTILPGNTLWRIIENVIRDEGVRRDVDVRVANVLSEIQDMTEREKRRIGIISGNIHLIFPGDVLCFKAEAKGKKKDIFLDTFRLVGC